MVAGLPDAAVRPFVFEGAEEAFNFSVPAQRVRRNQDVAGAELGERSAEGVAAGVALGVVAHHRLDRAAALLDKAARGARERDRNVGGFFAGVQLGINQTSVVVLNGDDDRVAKAARAAGSAAVAGHAMARNGQPRPLVGIDVQQRPWL